MDTTKPGWALIIAGGKPAKPTLAEQLDKPDWIVAADSGLDQANRLGLTPDLVIGDMDSVQPASLAAAESAGIKIKRHPEDKDATDLELAIDAVTTAGFGRATIIGGTGGRMAHTMANAMLLLQERSIELDWLTSRARTTALRSGQERTYLGTNGPLLSVLATGGPALCHSTGLKWPLADSPLLPGSTRGISNEIIDNAAIVGVSDGQALIIHERN
ncbi:MAG: thiamine diphosphokinase [bacterium]|nr:thiamine diphosphokinase [bacterium]